MSIVVAVLIFGAIVVIHEFGHYIAARKNGIMVEEFAIGMGFKLFSVKRGDTMWSIRLFPIGGYCKMLGEDEDNRDPRAFNSKKVWQRMIVLSGGVLMNILLALVITCSVSLFNGFGVPVIKEIVEGSPAAEAGLMPGDRITNIGGSKINIYDDVIFVMEEVNGDELEITVNRNGEKLTYAITPRFVTREDGSQGYQIGFIRDWHTAFFEGAEDGYVKAGFLESLSTGFYTSVFYVKSTFLGFIRMVTLKINPNQMAGPIGIVSMIDTNYNIAAEAGGFMAVFWTMLKFMSFLSANLAVVNLLPLPALDGGRLVFLAIEGIRRKPVDPNKEGLIHFVGFVLLMIFAVFVAYNDIMKII